MLLYIERWLKAPVQMEERGVVPHTACSPLAVANYYYPLFFFSALRIFDMWMARDACAHIFRVLRGRHHLSLQEHKKARVFCAIADRFAACKLVLHPQKTRDQSTARM